MKDAATKSYMKKGQAIVDANHKAIDAGATAFRKFEVPADWATAKDAAPVELSEETKSAIAQQVKDLHRAHRSHGRRQPACFRLRRLR